MSLIVISYEFNLTWGIGHPNSWRRYANGLPRLRLHVRFFEMLGTSRSGQVGIGQ
ncbi:MAG: hypothetical protein V7K32_13100 [Nostoc sp.]|uniref:hypothetical protein n=1 Tax=Nostoc sp. TaxID=1180 RepID=UPI002FFAFA78